MHRFEHRNRTLGAIVTGASLALLSTPLLAHHAMGGGTPQTLVQGLLSGVAHPVIGLDHLLILLVIGLLAAWRFSRTAVGLCVAFVGGTLLGTTLHLAALDIPVAEIIIALSVVAGGIVLWSGRQLNHIVLSLMGLAVGLFHGYAYGEAIVGAEPSPLAGYLAGFALIQAAIILGLGFGVSRLSRVHDQFTMRMKRLAGVAATLGGLAFLWPQIT